MSLLRAVTGFLVMALAVVLFSGVCLVLLPWRGLRIRACNYFGQVVGWTILRICGAHLPPGLRGKIDPTFPAIYVSNHTSPTDIFLGIWLAPVGTCGVAKKEVAWYPFFGQLYLISGHIRLDRKNHVNAVESLRETAVLIQKHHLGAWIWPEGTRSQDGRLLPFKKGFAHMAIATRLPIVPVVVTGAHRNWPKGTVQIVPAPVGVEILPPIPTLDWSIETLDAHVALVRQQFIDHLPADQRPETTALPASGFEAAHRHAARPGS